MRRILLCILFFFYFPKIQSDPACHGEERLDPSGRYCFILHPGEKSFHDAEKACYDYGGYHLASIPTMIDNNFLYKYLQSSNVYSNYFWIGLTDMTADGSWEWIDGTDLNFMYWAPDSSSSDGYCGAIRAHDGRWQEQDCAKAYPFFCYGRAPGAPTDSPMPPKTTVLPTRKEEVLMKFMADAESLGDPNTNQNAAEFYKNEREYIRSVTDVLFNNLVNGQNVCKYYMSPAFYGWIQYEQQFDSSPAWSQRQFDNLLEGTKWDDGKTDHAYNITDAIVGAQQFRWTPEREDMGYNVLVFLTARQDFTGIPSLFNPFPNFDEVIIVSLNGSKMMIPSGLNGVRNIVVSNSFSSYDVDNLVNVLKCH